jgi:hypothetical protein
MPYWIVQAGGSPGSCCAVCPRRRWWSVFLQPHKPAAGTSSPSAHTAGAASAGATSAEPVSTTSSPSPHAAGAASAGAASAGAASAGPVSAAGGQAASAAADVKLPSGLSAAALSAARPAGQQNPAQMKAAYSRLLGEFPAVVCASKRLPPVSRRPPHRHTWAAHRLQIPEAGWREVGGGES